MRLATLRTPRGTRAVRLDGDVAVNLGEPDVGALLARADWQEVAGSVTGTVTGTATGTVDVTGPLDLAAVVPQPGKVLCVGLNYRSHIREMGRELPEHPTLFAKFADALIGPRDDITLPPESAAVDWEAELAVVVGRPVRRAGVETAAAAIAGFTLLNDITMRDWQYRTREWLQGKTFEGTTPLGPVLVTPDELPGGIRPALDLVCEVDGEVVQLADTADLVFDPVSLVRYISTFTTLRPGDIIATGTPGGVGHARTPRRYLGAGSVVVTRAAGIGRLENTARPA